MVKQNASIMDADDKVWRGVHVSALQTSLNRYQYPKLINNDEHTILVKLPVDVGRIPECHPSIFNGRDYWDQTHVKLPCSEKNITKNYKCRWDMIREIFTNVSSSPQLESAILSYNHRYTEMWNFLTLNSFFEETLDEQESTFFFETLFPKIVDLALCLPQLITDGIPLLRQGCKHSLTLSQVQISCLLANAFLCTFPHRNWNGKNSEYCDYPDINFNRLFQCEDFSRTKSVHEKLKCIINYFRRVTTSVPSGIVTYSRQFVPNHLFPEWLKSNNKLPKLYVSSSGTIEDDGFGLFQVDFAKKYVGGGVIGTGCVQEEIRFVVCPELILSRLFTQVLGENEALVVTVGLSNVVDRENEPLVRATPRSLVGVNAGPETNIQFIRIASVNSRTLVRPKSFPHPHRCERFNRYRGYGQSFEWDGDYVDQTPNDEYGRKYCTVIALDALCYQGNPEAQYMPENLLRDLNKAYVGFSWGSRRKKEELCGIATGNWGCGVFAGNPQFKSIIQLMAASEVNRDLAYFTFGDTQLRDSMGDVHEFLFKNGITVGKICKLLLFYNAEKVYKNLGLFEFLKMAALKEEEPTQEKERHPNFSESKSFKIFSTAAMNKKHSLFYRMKTNETLNKVENEEDFNFDEPKGGFKGQKEPPTRPEDDTNQKRLMPDELRRFSGLYDTTVAPTRQDCNKYPKQDSFEFLDQIKQKMKTSFMKNPPRKKSEPKINDRLDRLETEISTQLSIDNEDENVELNVNGNCELEEIIIVERNALLRNVKTDLKVVHKENVVETSNNEESNEKTTVERVGEVEISKTKESTSTNRVTLSQLSARLSKSAPIKNKNSKERSCQKRKISDYFDPLNKKFDNT